MTDIQIKVMPALRLRGSLKAVMPLEMASTPVSAVVPFANACKRRKGVSAPTVCNRVSSGGSITVPKSACQKAEHTQPNSGKHHHDKEIGWDGKSGP